MSNVVSIDVYNKNLDSSNPDRFLYTEEDGLLGIKTISGSIKITDSGFGLLYVDGRATLPTSREALSEFLWAAAIFLDSEERYKPEGDFPALNY